MDGAALEGEENCNHDRHYYKNKYVRFTGLYCGYLELLRNARVGIVEIVLKAEVKRVEIIYHQ